MQNLRNCSPIVMESVLLKSKFRGCLLGSLLGDCLGAPFEGDTITSGDKIIIQRYFDNLEDPKCKVPYKMYTDDTAMMKSVARFLIDKPEPDYKFLAKNFVNNYFKEPRRGYGQGIVEVFHKLKNSKYNDIYKPATEQFLGSGSYGNGGAMRIAPIALFYYDKEKSMIDVATNATKITHTNVLGMNGALLQCMAIQQALLINPKDKVDTKKFCNDLLCKMKHIEVQESDDENDAETVDRAYQRKLEKVECLLNRLDNDDLDTEVIYNLGNGISAYESVPTAIYCFLKAQNEISRIETNNVFRRTIQYAITLGGDTDTIACMAGAIAGAHLGEDAINPNLIKQCESFNEIIEMADKLLVARDGP